MELREQILEGTIAVFKDKGIKLTMDDIAKEISISKKTIYVVFENKEDLFLAMVDYMFDSIKSSEKQILSNPNLSTVEKLKKVLGAMPEKYADLDLRQLYLLKDKFPHIYNQLEIRLENDWESTIALINHGIAEGVIRPVSIPILKIMLESAIEQFFQRDVLVQNDISYSKALSEVVNILVDGIVTH